MAKLYYVSVMLGATLFLEATIRKPLSSAYLGLCLCVCVRSGAAACVAVCVSRSCMYVVRPVLCGTGLIRLIHLVVPDYYKL